MNWKLFSNIKSWVPLYAYAHISSVKLLVLCSRSATYFKECLELLLKLDEVLTLISKLHTDSSIHI